jgi:transcriptional regulator CtsR
MAPHQLVMHAVNAVGDSIDYRSAEAILSNISNAGVLPPAQCKLMLCAVSDAALRPAPPEARDGLRASILKQLLVNSL